MILTIESHFLENDVVVEYEYEAPQKATRYDPPDYGYLNILKIEFKDFPGLTIEGWDKIETVEDELERIEGEINEYMEQRAKDAEEERKAMKYERYMERMDR